MKSLIPNQLGRVVLFEDLNDDYGAAFQGVDQLFDVEPIRTANVAVGEALAEASLKLEYLSASFIVDARHFLQARRPTWVWGKLLALALTSRSLTPGTNNSEINDLLHAAAVAATKMPKLDTFRAME